MNYEIGKVYRSLDHFDKVDGIADIKKDMDTLNSKISEYIAMARVNSYMVPSITSELESVKKEIEAKYGDALSKYKDTKTSYSVNLFGGDKYERELDSLNKELSKMAVEKISAHYGIGASLDEINASCSDVLNKVYEAETVEEAPKAKPTFSRFISDDDEMLKSKLCFKMPF
ncbi:MAG: hypothetical protein MJ246_07620 [Clostridia bacterium]|nr:hypothetical protein [Clostridia bacterium]